VESFETIMNCQATNYGNSFRIRNVETARITTTGLSIAPNNGNRNLTQALDVLGNSIVSGYTFSSGKIRFRIHHNNFTLPSGMASLLNGGTVDFQSNVTLSSGIFIANIAGLSISRDKRVLLKYLRNANDAPLGLFIGPCKDLCCLQ
jgi:hypothetical protein